MQQPTRYYITRSGEEPTVRSVRVKRGAVEPADAKEIDAVAVADHASVTSSDELRKRGIAVKDRLQGAIKKRVPAR